jgi:hypothetical protein
MRTETKIAVYEVNDKDCCMEDKRPEVVVTSHWNCDDMAVVTIGETSNTVNRHELISALQKAGNRP